MLSLLKAADEVTLAAVQLGCNSEWDVFTLSGEEQGVSEEIIKKDFRLYLEGEEPPPYVIEIVEKTLQGAERM